MKEKSVNLHPNSYIASMDKGAKYYRHFKGGKYILLAEGQESETLEEVVVYKALYGEGKVWVRPKAMFYGFVVKDGVEVPRFTEISEIEAYGEK